MHKNVVVADRNDRLEDEWLQKLYSLFDQQTRWSAIEKFISKHRDDHACKVTQRAHGGYNYCIKFEFEDGVNWIMRFALPGRTIHPNKKIEDEVAVMEFLTSKTNIPLPKVITYGKGPIGAVDLGPYIIMDHVKGQTLDDLLLTEEGNLCPDVKVETLQKIYRQMANILLQLNCLTFDKIGAPHMTMSSTSPEWSVVRGPLTLKTNDIERLGGVSSEHLLGRPFTSSVNYINALLEQSLLHLTENPMASETHEEACNDYKALRALQSSSPTFAASNDDHAFLLFNDDWRFGNMIVDDEYNIMALIDWEFSYAAPSSFLRSPPAWLIGTDPFEWQDTQEYESHFQMFLELLENEEHAGDFDNTLSTCMRKNWADGTFWYNLAIRESLPLAGVMKHCWDFLPTPSPIDDLEEFGKRKMEQRSHFQITEKLIGA